MATDMRLVSLLPSITEIVAALGLGGHLVGKTHECDYPADVIKQAAVVTSSDIQPYKMSQEEIHKAVCGSIANGHSLYGLDEAALTKAAPTHVFTQALCDVCAVSYPRVLRDCARLLGEGPRVVSLEPTSLQEVFTTIEVVGKECGVESAAAALNAQLQADLVRIKDAVAHALKDRARPKLAFLEWNDPLFTGGHWVPDMCHLAGATYTLGKSGERSVVLSVEDLVAYDPDVIVVAPCGFDAKRACEDTQKLWKHEWWASMRAVRAGEVYALDANSYFARPGPRLVAGAAIIAHLLHGTGDMGLFDPEDAIIKVAQP